jgi:hypothetical protein
VVRHSLRSLIKDGHQDALRLVGVEVDAPIDVTDFSAAPEIVRIGGAADVQCSLRLREGPAATVEIDICVHYANAQGALSRRKVFKFAKRDLAAGEAVTITRRVAFTPVSIRAIYPGTHRLELQVNGRIAATCTVEVV